MAEFDFSELDTLAADLDGAASNVGPYARKAVEVSARNVKDGARRRVRGRKHFKQGANAIDYELKGFQGFGATVLDAEIGYDKDHASGKLGNLIEYGAPGASNQLAPGSELQAALQETREDFVTGIEQAVDDALKASRL